MNCEKMFEIIPLIVNGSLGKEEERQALKHLMECESCRRELAFWTKVADSQPGFKKEFAADDREKIYKDLTRKDPTAWGLTRQAVKVYFKVIESILNI